MKAFINEKNAYGYTIGINVNLINFNLRELIV